jgi:hypothetical protein
MEDMMLVIPRNFANRKNCHLNKFDKKESRAIRSVVMFATILLVIGNGLQNTVAAPFDPAFEDYLTKVCSDRGSFQVGGNLSNVCSRFNPASGAVGSFFAIEPREHRRTQPRTTRTVISRV